MGYNLRGELSSVRDPLGKVTTFERDPNGRVITRTRASAMGSAGRNMPAQEATRLHSRLRRARLGKLDRLGAMLYTLRRAPNRDCKPYRNGNGYRNR